MQIQQVLSLASLFATSALAHSWLECVDASFKDGNLEDYVNDPSSFGLYIDPYTKITCNGYPRNKADHPEGNDQGAVGQWGWDSSNYAYDFDQGTPVQACSTLQSTATYPDGKPMTTAKAGQDLLLWFWGNGHTNYNVGSPNHRDPGLMRVYSTKKAGEDITLASDLVETNWIVGAQKNFSAEAITVYDDNAQSVGDMHEIANFMYFKVPEDLEDGQTYQFVWVWEWKQEGDSVGAWDENTYDDSWSKAWGTCFDVTIGEGSGSSSTSTSSSSASSSSASTESVESGSASVVSENGACSNKCLSAGQAGMYSDASSSPCYIAKADGSYDCYAKTDGACPAWDGVVDCSSSSSKRSIEGARSHMRKHKRWNN